MRRSAKVNYILNIQYSAHACKCYFRVLCAITPKNTVSTDCANKYPLFLFLIGNEQQVDETLKKKRTFKKFTYRGVDLDQLLDMPK